MKLSHVRFPLLLILPEKHGDRYFYAGDSKQLLAACLKIFEARFEQNYYNSGAEITTPPVYEDIFVSRLGMSTQAFENLPQVIKTDMAPRVNRAKQEFQWEWTARKQYALAKEIYHNKDEIGAYHFLLNQRDNQYEGFKMEHFENVKPERETIPPPISF